MTRKLLLFATSLLAALPPFALPAPAAAEAPMAGTQASGFYRFLLGRFEVTVLSDGTVSVPLDTLLSINPEGVRAQLRKAYRDPSYEMSFNSYLINTGNRLILVDAGFGRGGVATGGHLVENLRASGYRPEQVDEVYLTHMHEDHVGGLTINGRPVFPNAVVRAAAPEAAFWFAPGAQAKAPANTRRFFATAIGSLKPYVDAGRFKPFATGATLSPGIRAQATYGHTAGHTVYVVESGGQKLELWGDLVHAAEIQLPDPTVTIQFDSEPRLAAQQRARALADAAKQGFIVGAAHISFPGIGRFIKAGTGYSWTPLPYSTIVKPQK